MEATEATLSICEIGPSDEVVGYLLGETDDSTVARRVRDRFDPRRGKFYAILPQDLQPRQIEDWGCYRRELGYLVGPRNPHAIMDSVIRRFMANPLHRVIGKNWNQTVSDVDSRDMSTTVRYDDELYIELSGEDTRDDRLIVGRFSIRPFALFLYRSRAPKRTALCDKDIEEIVRELIGVVVMAFDDDSYLIWWRTDREPFPGSDLARTVSLTN